MKTSLKGTLTKRQKFLTGVVWAMVALLLVGFARTLTGGVLTHFIGTDSPLNIAITAAGDLFSVLMLLQLLLPLWRQSYQKWLGWLLGIGLLVSAANTCYTAVMNFTHHQERYFTIAMLISGIAFILLSPQFHLLRGIVFKKHTEKTAGILAAVGLGIILLSALLSQIFLILAEKNSFTLAGQNPATQPNVFFSILNILPGALIMAGYIIVCFSWPVLSKPLLEKETPEETEAETVNITF